MSPAFKTSIACSITGLTPTLIISFGIANIKGINLVPLPAGLIKNANNTFPATKISFINTIANICEKIPGA
ncbi:hypothetical protein D4R86_05135, partial [bacterium]